MARHTVAPTIKVTTMKTKYDDGFIFSGKYAREEANMVAYQNGGASGDEDGWTYHVVALRAYTYRVKVKDDQGEFVGYL